MMTNPVEINVIASIFLAKNSKEIASISADYALCACFVFLTHSVSIHLHVICYVKHKSLCLLYSKALKHLNLFC